VSQQLVSIILGVVQFYGYLIFAYVIMSWFPIRGIGADIYRVIGSLVEPYIGIFRRIIPPMGTLDLSPMVAYFVLIVVSRFVLSLL